MPLIGKLTLRFRQDVTKQEKCFPDRHGIYIDTEWPRSETKGIDIYPWGYQLQLGVGQGGRDCTVVAFSGTTNACKYL